MEAYELADIAQEVRDWIEEFASCRAGFSTSDLTGYCAIASAELFSRLHKLGVDAEIRVANDCGHCHVFVGVDDTIVDVTATQFSEFEKQPVVILHEKEAEPYWFYQEQHWFWSVASLRKFQIKSGWPQDQVALTRRVK